MIGFWVDEKAKYYGEVLTGENFGPFGHYTQMVWRNTKEVGCAAASGRGHPYFAGASKPADFMSILVCRYRPPGNDLGQKPY
jgi:Cysteine-rich secretory protein family